MSYRIGIDVGGTFTDFLLVGDGVRLVHKTSSTPDDPSRGVVTGLAELAARLDLTLEGLRCAARPDRARHDGHDERRAHPRAGRAPDCS